MSLNLKMLITVSMECLTERELGFGIALQLGNLEIYVKRIVATSGIINILKLHNVCQVETMKNGETIQQYINRTTYIKYRVV